MCSYLGLTAVCAGGRGEGGSYLGLTAAELWRCPRQPQSFRWSHDVAAPLLLSLVWLRSPRLPPRQAVEWRADNEKPVYI